MTTSRERYILFLIGEYHRGFWEFAAIAAAVWFAYAFFLDAKSALEMWVMFGFAGACATASIVLFVLQLRAIKALGQMSDG